MRTRTLAVLATLILGATLLGCDGGDDDEGVGDGCRSNADCDSDLYCEKPVGECDATGTCEIMPEPCLAIWAPVCGCDGITYGNSCEAAGSGVSVGDPAPCP